MTRRSHRPEQIIKKLREAEVLLSQGSIVGEATRKIGVTEQTYYRWRREYGGIRIEEVKRLKELEKENFRLKRLIVDLSLDNAILKEADEAKLLSPSKRRNMVDTVLKTLKVS
jgi:transposase-like protein